VLLLFPPGTTCVDFGRRMLVTILTVTTRGTVLGASRGNRTHRSTVWRKGESQGKLSQERDLTRFLSSYCHSSEKIVAWRDSRSCGYQGISQVCKLFSQILTAHCLNGVRYHYGTSTFARPVRQHPDRRSCGPRRLPIDDPDCSHGCFRYRQLLLLRAALGPRQKSLIDIEIATDVAFPRPKSVTSSSSQPRLKIWTGSLFRYPSFSSQSHRFYQRTDFSSQYASG
jgi:hypothetical protein